MIMKNNKLKIFLFIILLGILFIPKITITSAEEARSETTRTITIKGAGKDHTFKAYQIFKGDLHTEDGKDVLSNIKWGDSVNGENLLNALKASEDSVIEVIADSGSSGTSKQVKEIFKNCTTARDVAEVLALYENDSDMLRIFAELASSNLKTDAEGSSTVSSTYKQDTSSYALDVPTDGYYLIKDVTPDLKETNEFYTRYILKVANNVEVKVKGEVPTVEKSVASTDKGKDEVDSNYSNQELKNEKVLSAETGEALEFTLTGTLPTNYKDYKTYQYIFHDTLSKGLSFIDNSIKVYKVIDGTETEIRLCGTAEHTDCYSSEHVTKEDDGTTTLKITIEDLKKVISDTDFDKGTKKEENKEPKIIVKYYASLNKDAVVGENGNTNTVYLEYSNNPNKEGSGKTGNTPEEKVTVYTYQLNINKKDGKKQKALQGAGFKLYKKIKDADGETDKKVYAVMVENSGGSSSNPYVIEKWIDDENSATEMTTDSEGHISIKGLEDGTYYLKESTTPKGYNTIEDVEIIIKETIKGNEEQATEQSLDSLSIDVSWKDNEKEQKGDTSTTGDPTSGVVETTILNMPGSILPFTGGMGTLLFYIIGFVLVITSFIIIGIKYKKLNKEKSNK